ncbi:MAG: LysM peptidoglycan-binding domain-containing protein, partial [Pseudobdellovibrionaceae bacterium]
EVEAANTAVDEAAPADGVSEQASDQAATAETLPDDALSSAPVTDELSAEEPMPTTDASSEVAASPDTLAPADGTLTPEQAPLPDSFASSTPSETPVTTDSTTDSSSESISSDTGSEKSIATAGTTASTYSSGSSGGSLQKVALTPWRVNGVLYNAVYFAKPGDTLKGISKIVYGSDKTRELKKGNPMFKSRSVKPGDKIYYTSSSRPQDDTRVLSYYEDQGMQPEVYVAKDGDTVKSVSKELFGYRDGWKELYSMNSFESKGSLPAGTEIRYFPMTKGSPVVAQNNVAPPAEIQTPPVQIAPPETDVAMTPPPQEMVPPAEMASPPPSEAMAELPPPPPPPPIETPQEMAPPPPPPSVAETPKRPVVAEESMEAPPVWEDTTVMLGAGAIALIAIGGIFVVRSRKKRQQEELDAALNQQVGS